MGGKAAQVRPEQHKPRVVEGSWHCTPWARQVGDVVVTAVVEVVVVVLMGRQKARLRDGKGVQVWPEQHRPRVVEGSWHAAPWTRQFGDVVVGVVVVVVQVELATAEHT